MYVGKCPPPESDAEVRDEFGYKGYVSFDNQELDEIGYEITSISSDEGDYHGDKIKVINLKELIDKTFSCQWIPPYNK